MDKQLLKRAVCEEIDRNSGKIIEIAEHILANPELGYKERATAEYVKEQLSSLGIPCRDGLALTGVKGRLKGGRSEANVCVIGELDAVLCNTHPTANKESGAAHACGHNAQLAAMLGVAIGLSKYASELDGDVTFFAVPAEEFVEIGYRDSLAKDGKIKYLGGKQELIRLGEFDDIDAAMMVHAQGNTPGNEVFVDGGSLGFVAKTVEFIGKAAHAGGAPHEGINALNAAMAAMMCIHAQRETFRDEDKIRVHPIITNGGELVNVVPANVTMETYVRGASFEAIKDAASKVDRAIKGSAYAIGAEAEITDFKGYLPLCQDKALGAIFAENAAQFTERENIHYGIDMVGSTDMGDLCHLIPAIQPTMGGWFGNLHAKDFAPADKALAYINPAKIMAMTVIDLLYDGASVAKKIKSSFVPKLTKEEYFNF